MPHLALKPFCSIHDGSFLFEPRSNYRGEIGCLKRREKLSKLLVARFAGVKSAQETPERHLPFRGSLLIRYPLKTVQYDLPLKFKKYSEWLEWMEAYFYEQYRVSSSDGGRVAMNIDDVNETFGDNAELVYAAADDLRRLAVDVGYKYRGRIIWYKQNANGTKPLHGQWQNPWVQRTSEPILLFHKGSASLI
ncbi:MAG: Methyltransferase, partial [Phycisphaerales bacterium]|nr:Methyltransferase [Phycisphaerales bacterium]